MRNSKDNNVIMALWYVLFPNGTKDWETGPVVISRKALAQALRSTLGRGPGTERRGQTELGMFLRNYVPGLAEAKRARRGPGGQGVYPIASLDECRAHFESIAGGEIDWDE